jgi:peptidoglycan/LPS O-acetylase OafA/YrhL
MTMIADEPVQETRRVPDGGPRPHLGYLDSIRGLAALYVALGHAYVSIRPQMKMELMNPWAVRFLKLTDLGHFAVAVFIVLSGFCLTIPVARSEDGALPGGKLAFFKRRSRRILPPYYAALVLSILAMWLLGAALGEQNRPRQPQSAFGPGDVFSHAFLVHNLSQHWMETINGPLWSVALEYQIYFLFPLVLLPVGRRFGVGAAVAAGFAIGLAPLVLPAEWNLRWTFPWYLGLFSLGMAGAVICFDREAWANRLRVGFPWGATAGVLFGGFALAVAVNVKVVWAVLWLTDALIGVATVSLIVFLGRTQRPSVAGRRLREALSASYLMRLGAFSYSLYLIHMPIMVVTSELVRETGLAPLARLGLQAVIVLPATVAIAYLFHLAFEKPFMSSGQPKRPVEAAPAG